MGIVKNPHNEKADGDVELDDINGGSSKQERELSPDEKPREFDPKWRGPKDRKRCPRDIPCAILFLLYWGGLFVLLWLGYTRGDIERFDNAYDSQGYICGVNNLPNGPDYTNKPNVYIYDIWKCVTDDELDLECRTASVCVETCPTQSIVFADSSLGGDDSLSKTGGGSIAKGSTSPPDLCQRGIDYTRPYYELMGEQACPAYLLASQAFVGRCVPITSEFTELVFSTGETVPDSFLGSPIETGITDVTELEFADIALFALMAIQRDVYAVVEDVISGWYIIAIACGVGLLLTFLYLLLLRWFAKPVIYATIILTNLAMWALTGFLFYEFYRFYVDIHPGYSWTVTVRETFADVGIKVDEGLWSLQTQEDVTLAFAIIAAVISLILTLLCIALRSAIKVSIAIIAETSRASAKVFLVYFYPIFTFLGIVALAVYGIYTAILIYTTGENVFYLPNEFGEYSQLCAACPVPATSADVECTGGYGPKSPENCCCTSDTPSVFAVQDAEISRRWLYIYLVCGLLWSFNFAMDWTQMTIAGSFAHYYWTMNKKKISWPVWTAYKNTLFYHLGTVAFGSLILTIIQIIRAILKYIERKVTKERTGIAKKIMKYIFKIVHCLLYCLEKIVKFINRNAYIEAAVYGYGFCKAARRAFYLIFRNVVKMAVVTNMTTVILFMGRLFISALTTTGAYFYIDNAQKTVAEGGIEELQLFGPTTINNPFFPLALIFVITWLVCLAFFSIYSMGMSTIFLCYCEDTERHDGSDEKPFYATKTLLKIMNEKAKKKKKEESNGPVVGDRRSHASEPEEEQ